ncbi:MULTISPECIES: restriction endonuclease subunit S [Faecalibacterium]|uniref:restriction endonuclease subunit S n=1 Tax=Faecalibacterium TaxID=216851 RepID=UPI001D0F1831|nr:restriction endonuclease subunit S [Faecalibacterium hominis (ex Afrizal et al. 2022)]
MKDSGIEWIGEIPEGWEIIPVKYLAKYNYDTLAESCSPDFEFSYIDIGSVTYTDGITNYQNFKFKDAPSRARRIVHSGDILVSTVRTYLRAVACVNEHRLPQIASTGFLVLQADISKIHPHFLMYSVLSDNFICKVEANSVGISYPAINASQIVHFKLPIPQLSEQFLLVTYLDRQCSEIDALLSKTLSSIEEYKKLKQAVITQAVTKGVRGEREMKDSGVEWIGEIPAEWSVQRIKTIFSIRNERNYLPLEQVNLISLYTDKGVVQHCDIEKTTGNKASNADGYKKVYPNDMIVNIILCWMGAIGRSNYAGVTSPAYDVYVPSSKIECKFYHYYFRTLGFSGDCYKNGRGIMAMRWRTYSDQFRSIKVVVPPLEEQKEIVGYLDAKCAEIDGLIAKKEQLIKELESYKKSLIYEVVTGKREV